MSIVLLEVLAEPCDLGQGMREAINNSKQEGAVFWAKNSFKNCATSLPGLGEAVAATNKDGKVSF